MTLLIVGAALCGLGAGLQLSHVLIVRPLIRDLQRMQQLGFRPVPTVERSKLAPPPLMPRED